MEAIFNEEMIREELRRIDQKTGLNAASLPISFGNAKCYLGYFSYPNDKSLKFYFSNHYFTDPMFPVEEKLDVIRHEYAHYMDYMLNGSSSHGPRWKKYCKIVGAYPMRCYSKDRSDYFLKKHKEEEETNLKCDSYTVGRTVKHPSFGQGSITEILGEGISRIAVIKFNNGNCKKLLLSWVTQNCQ